MAHTDKIPNLGPKSRQWLAEVGIETLEDVEALGAIEAYLRVKAAFPDRVTLNMLYGLQAALMGLRWNQLPPEVKADLKKQVGRD